MVRLVLIALLLWTCAAKAQGIYRWANDDGIGTYSDQPPPAGADSVTIQPEELPELHVVPALALPDEEPKPTQNQDEKNR